MGYYLDPPGIDATDKAKFLHQHYNAELVFHPESFDFSGDYALICVVENGLFDAAAIAYDADERDAFNDPSDSRPRVWLKMKKKVVKKLNPNVPI